MKFLKDNRGSAGVVGAVVFAVLIIVTLIGLLTCSVRVPVGQKAIVYTMSKGCNGETLSQGWHLISPTKHAKMFTISNEQLLLTKDKREGSEEDESFKVSTADDASIAISFQMSYRFNEASLVDTYKKFKGMNGEEIVNNRVRTVLKSRISEVTTDYSMMDIYSGNRSEINTKITDYLNDKFNKEYGIEVIDASITDVHPDEKLQKTIDARVEALQNKQKAEAEQQTIKVQAETAIIEAQKDADIKVTKAKAEAEAVAIAAEAEAAANKKIAESITDELIDYKTAEARMEHGWVEVNGASTVVKEKK